MGFGALVNGAGLAGVTLESAHDFARKRVDEANADANQASRSRRDASTQELADLQVADAKRDAEHRAAYRAISEKHMASVNPPPVTDPAAPPPAPVDQPPAPAAEAPPSAIPQPVDVQGGDDASGNGTMAPDAPAVPAGSPVQATAPVQQSAPPPQVAIPGITPGVTLSASAPKAPPVQAQAAVTPAGGASLPARPAPAPVAAPAPQRMGRLDALIAEASRRGDFKGEAKFRADKKTLEDEGLRAAAHDVMRNPDDVATITKSFNEAGVIRIVPGTLKPETFIKDGKVRYTGEYEATIVNADGKQMPGRLDFKQIAVDAGVIAAPAVVKVKTDENAYVNDHGKLTLVQEGQKYDAKVGRDGNGIVFNKVNGRYERIGADGKRAPLTTDQTNGIKEVNQFINKEASDRASQVPGVVGNKPQIDRMTVASIARNIFVNNQDKDEKSGFSPTTAGKVALAFVDKSPDVKTGQAMFEGEKWNILGYGSGENAQTYRVSRVAQQPVAPTPAPSAAPGPKSRNQYDLAAEAAAKADAAKPTGAPSLPKPPKASQRGFFATPEKYAEHVAAQQAEQQADAAGAEKAKAVKRGDFEKRAAAATTPKARMQLFNEFMDVMTPQERRQYASGR